METNTPPTIYTVGHSTHPIETFITKLRSFAIETLVDVRSLPQSRYNPQFGQEALARSLAAHHIAYRHMRALGGLRPALKTPPAGRGAAFGGYAANMQSPGFQDALNTLIEDAKLSRTVIMCAEAAPSRCHRFLISNALLERGIAVEHILAENRSTPHVLTQPKPVQGELVF